jgi:hypothetical protein
VFEQRRRRSIGNIKLDSVEQRRWRSFFRFAEHHPTTTFDSLD